jgi:hypothetical protein
MTIAIAATIFSVLSKPSCSLDVFDPCIIDRMEPESSVDPVSSTGDTPLLVGKNPHRSTSTAYKRETPAREQMDLNLLERIPTSVYRRNDQIQITPSRVLRTRIDGLEEQCDSYRRKLRESISETAHDRPEPPRPYKGSNGGEVEGKDIPSGLDVHIVSKTKQQQRRSMRLVGSASEPQLPNASTKTASRKRRALDLGISGTPKFRLDHGSNAATRPKLVRLQNRWRRIGRR